MSGAVAAPRITVAIPLYNRRDLIEATLRSVLAQTHAAFEILVLDDGSTDGSADIVQALAAQHSAIRYVHQANAGEGAARNALLREFRGDWIAFLDSDDEWLPGKLAAAVDLIRADAAIELVHSNRAHRWPDGRQDNGRVGVDASRMVEPLYLIQDWRTKISTLLLHRTLVERLQPRWFTSLAVCADYEFMWRAIVAARKIGYAPQVDTLILMSDDGMSRATAMVRHHRLNIQAMGLAIDWMRAHDGTGRFAAVLEERRYREWQALIAAQYADAPRGMLSAARQCVRDLRPLRGLKAVVSGTLAARRGEAGRLERN